MAIGVISDTHGLLRVEAREAFARERIDFACGRFGDGRGAAGVEAHCARGGGARQRGRGELGEQLPAVEVAEWAGKSFYILHRIADLDLKPKTAGWPP